MKQIRTFIFLFALCVFMPLMPAASAATAVSYTDENGNTQNCTNYTVVTSSTGPTWSEGWYVVNSTVEISSRVSVNGHVRLILVDGCSLSVGSGIEVNNPNSITIYGQSANSGKLACGASNYCAAIGGGKYQGDNPSASRSYGDITINGGTVEATGGYWAAGIGAGTAKDFDNKLGGTITINGGNITATGGRAGAGIGGGYSSSTGTITINAGNINATAGYGGSELFATAIGGGLYNDCSVLNSEVGTVNINGGRITTTTYNYSPYGYRPGVGTASGGKYLTINLSWTRASDRYAISVPSITSNEMMSDGCYGNKNYLKTFEKGWENNRQILVPHKGYNFHGKKDPTCTEHGYSRNCYQCPECGKYFTDNTVPTECDKSEVYLDPLGHDMEYTAAVPATFTSNGHIAYYHCKRCNKYFKDSAGKFEITLAETVTTAVTYLDENGVEQTLASGISVTATNAVWSNGWYIVDHDVTFDARVSVNGTVNLLLLDGKTLTTNNGIEVKRGNTFRIYAQSTDQNTMGKLMASLDEDDKKSENYSTIGGSMSFYHRNALNEVNGRAGTIAINGGNLDVSGYGGCFSIGDGEVDYEDENDDDKKFFTTTTFNLTINGGILRLYDGWYGSIGSQAKQAIITINGGKIIAGDGRASQYTTTSSYGIGYGRESSLIINDTGRPLEITSTYDAFYYGSFTISGNLMLNDGTGTDAVVNHIDNYKYSTNFSGKTLVNYRTVTFDDFGTTASEKIPFGTAVREPSHSSHPGHTFVAWAANDDLYDFSAPVTSDLTITSKYRDLTQFGYTSSYTPDGSQDKPYIISTINEWNAFCDALQDNVTWNRFSGQTVKMGNDIGTKQQPVTRMAGTSHHDFCGIFDGDGNTLYVNINSDAITAEPYQYVAPFRYVSTVTTNNVEAPATIKRLKVAGTITTSRQFAGGIIGGCWGTVNIDDCAVAVTINSSVAGDGTHGGLVGIQQNGKLYIRGSVFNGQMLTTNGTTKCGGFLGYRKGNAIFYNSLFAPTLVTIANEGSATFARNNVDTYNCYYTYLLNDGNNHKPAYPNDATNPDKWHNGKQAYILDTPPANIGTADAAYSVSRITPYANGLYWNGHYYMMPQAITLADNGTNDIAAINGCFTTVTLSGRTLYKDGDWNTLCLPFDMTAEQVTAQLAPAKLMTLDGTASSLTNGTLTLNFTEATTIHAGVPYIIKWTKTDDTEWKNPVFAGVTVVGGSPADKAVTSTDSKATFLGTYNPIVWETENTSILFLGANNTLYYPESGAAIGALRAYFHLVSDQAREFHLSFGQQETTIADVDSHSSLNTHHSSLPVWYTLNGVKLDSKPTRKGMYIVNGHKVAIK